jgi:hypothetical protein
VLELSSQGYSQIDIANTLQIALGTVNKDLLFLRQQAQENLMTHIHDRVLFKVYDYTEAEIARRTNLTPKMVSKELENLVNEEVIKLTRKIGRSNMYTLNDSVQIRGLVQFIEY